MTPNLTKNELKTFKAIEAENKEKQELKAFTFGEICGYLWDVLKWRLSKPKYIGTRIFIAGKMRTVTSESFDSISVKGLSHQIRKNSRYLKKA